MDQSLNGVAYPSCAEAHDFEFVVNASGDLLRIICADCGSQWKCEPV